MSKVVPFRGPAQKENVEPVLAGLLEIADTFVPVGLRLREAAIGEAEKIEILRAMLQAAHLIMTATSLYIEATACGPGELPDNPPQEVKDEVVTRWPFRSPER